MAEKRTTHPAMRLAAQDNIAVALRALSRGEAVEVDGTTIRIDRDIPVGHKFAFAPIARGEIVRKYNCPIGSATQAITPGEYVHTHNVASNYLPTYTLPP